jgi:hypothetical protein
VHSHGGSALAAYRFLFALSYLFLGVFYAKIWTKKAGFTAIAVNELLTNILESLQ